MNKLLILIIGSVLILSACSPLSSCIKGLESRGLEAGEDYAPGEIIVSFEDGTTNDEINKIIGSYELEIIQIQKSSPVALVKVPQGSEYKWICKLEKNQNLRYAEINVIFRAA